MPACVSTAASVVPAPTYTEPFCSSMPCISVTSAWMAAWSAELRFGSGTDALQQGLEDVFARHALLARATRAGVAALGLELFGDPDERSNVVTAVELGSTGATLISAVG